MLSSGEDYVVTEWVNNNDLEPPFVFLVSSDNIEARIPTRLRCRVTICY